MVVVTLLGGGARRIVLPSKTAAGMFGTAAPTIFQLHALESRTAHGRSDGDSAGT